MLTRLVLIIFLVCLETAAVNIKETNDATDSKKISESIAKIFTKIFACQMQKGSSDITIQLEEDEYNEYHQAAASINNLPVNPPKRVLRGLSVNNFPIAIRFCSNEGGKIQLTICSESPHIKTSTYIIDEDKKIKKVSLSEIDINDIQTYKYLLEQPPQ